MPGKNTDQRSLKQGLILAIIFTSVPPVVLVIGISGDWGWLWGWLFTGILGLGFVVSRIIAHRAHPDLLTERAQFTRQRNEKGWDRWLSVPALIIGTVLLYSVSGLDHRYGWSPALPSWVQVAAMIIVVLGYAVGTWAMVANRFFSVHVRIQTERGHTVQTGGPYRFVRHPGYASTIITYFAYALMLGSLWALIPAAVSNSLFVARTALEDRTLQAELPGYREYTQITRYRLFPGIW